MATSVYSRQKTVHKGSFASDLAALTVAGSNTPLGIVQNVQLQFSQQIARIYDVSNGGSNKGECPVYYVGGRTQGQATIARVLGPQSGAICSFYEEMGNVCSPQDLSFTFSSGCAEPIASSSTASGQDPSVTYSIQDAVMTNLGIQVGSQDMIVNENVSLMFANLTCNNG